MGGAKIRSSRRRFPGAAPLDAELAYCRTISTRRLPCSTPPSTVGMAFSLSPRARERDAFGGDAASDQGFRGRRRRPHRQGQIVFFRSGPVGMAGRPDPDPVDPLGGGIGQHAVDDGPGVCSMSTLSRSKYTRYDSARPLPSASRASARAEHCGLEPVVAFREMIFARAPAAGRPSTSCVSCSQQSKATCAWAAAWGLLSG